MIVLSNVIINHIKWTVVWRASCSGGFDVIHQHHCALGQILWNNLHCPLGHKCTMGNHFGTALYTVPDFVKYSGKSQHRVGKDSLDWFFRGFNKLRLYENFLRTMPRFMGFSLTMGALGSFYWSQAWDRWRKIPQRKFSGVTRKNLKIILNLKLQNHQSFRPNHNILRH